MSLFGGDRRGGLRARGRGRAPAVERAVQSRRRRSSGRPDGSDAKKIAASCSAAIARPARARRGAIRVDDWDACSSLRPHLVAGDGIVYDQVRPGSPPTEPRISPLHRPLDSANPFPTWRTDSASRLLVGHREPAAARPAATASGPARWWPHGKVAGLPTSRHRLAEHGLAPTAPWSARPASTSSGPALSTGLRHRAHPRRGVQSSGPPPSPPLGRRMCDLGNCWRRGWHRGAAPAIETREAHGALRPCAWCQRALLTVHAAKSSGSLDRTTSENRDDDHPGLLGLLRSAVARRHSIPDAWSEGARNGAGWATRPGDWLDPVSRLEAL